VLVASAVLTLVAAALIERLHDSGGAHAVRTALVALAIATNAANASTSATRRC